MANTKKRGTKRRKPGPTRMELLRPVAPPDMRPASRGEAPNRAPRRAKRTPPRRQRPPRPIAQLEDGLIGYACDPMRWEDCFRAAIATATQIDIEQVPDFRLKDRFHAGEDPDEISASSWERIARWLDSRGLQLVFLTVRIVL